MTDKKDYTEIILKTLQGAEDDGSMKVKSLRKLVLLSLQINEDEKDGKKQFKKSIKSLESQEKISLNLDGVVKLIKTKKKKKKKKRKRENDNDDNSHEDQVDETKKKSKKEKKEKHSNKLNENQKIKHPENDNDDESTSSKDETSPSQEQEQPSSSLISPPKNKPCKGNPQGITRLFLGNLAFAVDETTLSNFLPGEVTHIKWITDKETGRFYGSAFVEMKNSLDAALTVSSIDGKFFMNRPIKINYAPSRPGDVWPPPQKVVTGGKILQNSAGATAGGTGISAMGEKPANCKKLFIGNLPYTIDDEGIFKFFGTVDAEVKAVRWIHHKDTGDFKGVGFVEFWNEEACNKGATLNGKNLIGRPVRIDWTD